MSPIPLVFGSLGAVLLCFPLIVKGTDECCHGYRVKDVNPIEIVQVEDESKRFKFSEDFRFKFDKDCNMVMAGCMEVPPVEKTFTAFYNVSKEGLFYHDNYDGYLDEDENGIDVCEELEENAENGGEYEQMGCFLHWFSNGAPKCPITPKGPICNTMCDLGGKLKAEHMGYINGISSANLKLKIDGKLIEMNLLVDVEKCD